MNTRLQIRLLLAAGLLVLALPAMAHATPISVAFVVYQSNISSGSPDGNPGTNQFFFGWLTLPLTLTDVRFSVTGIDADGAPLATLPYDVPSPIDESQGLAGPGFPTNTMVMTAQFWAHATADVLIIDDVSYLVPEQDVYGQMVGSPLVPFGLDSDGAGDFIDLQVEAEPAATPIPEPATLWLAASGVVLAARRLRLAHRR